MLSHTEAKAGKDLLRVLYISAILSTLGLAVEKVACSVELQVGPLPIGDANATLEELRTIPWAKHPFTNVGEQWRFPAIARVR